jgi:hypothetical protein
MINKLSKEEMEKGYSKYYFMELSNPDEKIIKILDDGAMNIENVILLEDREKILLCDNSDKKMGYCVLENGSAYVSTVTKMEGVTVEMFDWWFAWHGLESLRYKIWDREDHFDVKTTKREQLLDVNLSDKEKIWGVTHTVVENTGCGPETIEINFLPPNEFFKNGIEGSKVETVVWGNGSSAVMCHTIHKIPNGIELSSHFWLGYNLINNQVVRIIPDFVKIPLEAPKGLAYHSVKEYSNLAKILPSIYKEESGK